MIICEACYNIVHMKFPLESKKKYQLKKRLTPIKKDVMQLANPKILMKNKRKLLKKQQVGFGVFTALASFVIPALLSMSKMSRNIFYASNVQTDLFPNNS